MRRALLAVALAALALQQAPRAERAKKVLVLGIDGLDPVLLRRFVGEGALPNFGRLIAAGDFKPLETSMPPLSPIAWSTFITGMDPGGHAIFDFIHRDPATLIPYLSMSRTVAPSLELRLGSWVFPLKGGRVENLRRGRAFWQILDERGIPTTVLRMPANYPPAPSGGHALSGMGTPEIRGTSASFSYYTERPVPGEARFSGGQAYRVRRTGDAIEAELHGPRNSFRRENPELTVPFKVWLDPERPLGKLDVQGTEFILQQGEWSPWVRVDFQALPLLASVSAIGRFYLQEARPEFRLYVTSLQVNPEDPALPISDPEDWAHELWEELGYFNTKELPEDTKALMHGVLSGQEFWQQAQSVYQELRRGLDRALEHFDAGLLFYYFSSVDQNCHMLWRYMDPQHPGYVADPALADGIRTIYRELDEAVGRTLAAVDDDTTLIVMSDHGFGPFYWGVNLNTWLAERGYVALEDRENQEDYELFENVDWSRTRAYALGLNGIYVNLAGRERQGSVDPAAYQALVDRIEAELLELKDPRNGQNVVTLVVQPRRDFHGEHAADGPDLIVGYNRGYRSSWQSPLGKFPREVFVDNKEPWSGDHAIDYRLVPGVLISNRRITLERPALYDLTVSILDEYGIPKPPQMIGRDCLGERIPARPRP